jgi:hypothetical protein
MTIPPRTIAAIILAAILVSLAVWAVLALSYARGLASTATQRRLLAFAVALVFALLAAWVIFILPAYWD